MLGKQLGTLVSGEHYAGDYEIGVDARSFANGHGLSSGVYLYQLRSRRHHETRKMVVLH